MKKILLTLAVLIPIAWGMSSYGNSDHSTDGQSTGHIDGEARYIQIMRTDSFFDNSSDELLLQVGHSACQALNNNSVSAVVAAAANSNVPDYQAGEAVGAAVVLCPEFTAKLQAYAG